MLGDLLKNSLDVFAKISNIVFEIVVFRGVWVVTKSSYERENISTSWIRFDVQFCSLSGNSLALFVAGL